LRRSIIASSFGTRSGAHLPPPRFLAQIIEVIAARDQTGGVNSSVVEVAPTFDPLPIIERGDRSPPHKETATFVSRIIPFILVQSAQPVCGQSEKIAPDLRRFVITSDRAR